MNVLLLALLLQHPIVSAKAGYITYFHGTTSAKLKDFIEQDVPVRTFRHTLIEAMLNSGSYLRIDENSEVVLESAAIDRVRLRLNKGSIVIETANSKRKRPITIVSERLEFQIVKPGFYRFSEGTANVLKGRLELPALEMAINRGWKMIWFESSIATITIQKFESHPLERWSRYRSSLIYARQEPRQRKTDQVMFGGWIIPTR